MALLDPSIWTDKIYVNGWREGGAGSADAVEPATGKTLGSYGVASVEDVLEAARTAAAAQKEWAARKPEERAAVLRRAGALWEEHAEELGGWITREAGSIPPKAGLETHSAANECYDASALPSHPAGEVLATNEQRWSFSRRRPAGVVSVIAPFNFPVILSIRAVAPALALGNAVLLKPDPRTAVCGGVALMRVFEEAGLPAGLLSLLPGGAEIGAAVVEAPEVRVIAFTGSTGAGRKIAESAGRLLKRAHLELGGNNAMIVLPGADLAKAASAAAFGSFMHQGQICMTTGRHIVHEDIYEQYVEALAEKAAHLPVGDPAAGNVALGPIIDENQLKKIDGIVQDAVAAGARLAAGGTSDALFYRPTVLADVTPENPAWRQEIFGPVAPVMKFSTVDEAVELANDSEYGLSLSILGDVGMAMDIADRVESGKVHINEQTVNDESNAPFGGVKDSGNGGRVGGAAANLESFTEIQWLTMRPEIAPYPF
ncbi:aldehyde dehydrogenase family protein [Arthrobacter koreensis]|jgi:benzaldehyde dehydrogenase (NAD)|uniref:Aldehyde dehydrogenase family protein n=1 Tax=Arthrobacter koreensis TaxID=199136 RepID=A0ABY6FV45_9MICC|nr:aldehyde dehydrogenase family protein [Arthrobacter koreensis]MDF2496807.1 aldehyde dehydrogenase family protein [Arthrobacter koreensis]MEB7447818.1 aldehyde dehydrogenase family protein [Arthrobacter koreensis]UYB36584.1 aldehyde dehydrogenase family protein [Arthrobacter koreensis]